MVKTNDVNGPSTERPNVFRRLANAMTRGLTKGRNSNERPEAVREKRQPGLLRRGCGAVARAVSRCFCVGRRRRADVSGERVVEAVPARADSAAGDGEQQPAVTAADHVETAANHAMTAVDFAASSDDDGAAPATQPRPGAPSSAAVSKPFSVAIPQTAVAVISRDAVVARALARPGPVSAEQRSTLLPTTAASAWARRMVLSAALQTTVGRVDVGLAIAARVYRLWYDPATAAVRPSTRLADVPIAPPACCGRPVIRGRFGNRLTSQTANATDGDAVQERPQHDSAPAVVARSSDRPVAREERSRRSNTVGNSIIACRRLGLAQPTYQFNCRVIPTATASVHENIVRCLFLLPDGRTVVSSGVATTKCEAKRLAASTMLEWITAISGNNSRLSNLPYRFE